MERQLELVKESEDISEENKKTIFEFKDYLFSEGLGVARIGRYLLDLRKLAKMLNMPFPDAGAKDIRKVVAEIEQSHLSSESKKCFKILLRKLYRFLRNVVEKKEYPEEVKWISIAIPKNHKKLPEELLTEDEIQKMIRNCNNVRDKAFIACLAESGARIAEIATMKIKHISFEEYGARLNISGKTGPRKILVIWSSPYLQDWINNHPGNDNSDSFVWEGRGKDALSYARLSHILKKVAKKAGIKKRIYCHLFRHTRATRTASIMPEQAMKAYFGWGQDSKMAGIYVHMSGKDTDESILRANGIEVKKEVAISKLIAVKCLRCKTQNGSTSRFCKTCGLPLDEKESNKILNEDVERSRADEIMNKLMEDEEVLKLIKKKLA